MEFSCDNNLHHDAATVCVCVCVCMRACVCVFLKTCYVKQVVSAFTDDNLITLSAVCFTGER